TQLFSDKGLYEHLGSGPFVFLGRKHEINPMPGCPSNPRPTQPQEFKGLQLQLHFSERNRKKTLLCSSQPPAPAGCSKGTAKPQPKEEELWKCRGCGKSGKPRAGFPLFPQAPWKSRQKTARFPHSHNSGDEGG